jgi:hypothetical protein
MNVDNSVQPKNEDRPRKRFDWLMEEWVVQLVLVVAVVGVVADSLLSLGGQSIV